MSEYFEEEVVEEGVVIRLYPDQDAEDPTEWLFDGGLTLHAFSRNYRLGESPFKNPEDLEEYMKEVWTDKAEELFPDRVGEQAVLLYWDGELKLRVKQVYLRCEDEDTDDTEVLKAYFLKDTDYYLDPDECSWRDHLTADEQLEVENAANSLFFPVYLYDHSGISISMGPFGCPWDSGQVGYIEADRQRLVRNGWKIEDLTNAKLEELAQSAIETYDQYLTGDVWVVTIEWKSDDPDDPQEFEDSCGGFYGDDHAWEDGRIMAQGVVEQVREYKQNKCVGAGI